MAVDRGLSCCMGVGDGRGQLFVYGDHDSIKAAQRIVLQAEAAAREVLALRAALEKAEERAGRMARALTCIAEWAETADDSEAVAGLAQTAKIARAALAEQKEGDHG